MYAVLGALYEEFSQLEPSFESFISGLRDHVVLLFF